MEKITTEAEYNAVSQEVRALCDKGFDSLTEADDKRLDELSEAMQVWEGKHYQMPLNVDSL